MSSAGITEFTSEFFDESSRAWMENKIRFGASIKYKCKYIHSNQKPCNKPVFIDAIKGAIPQCDYCKQHYKLMRMRADGKKVLK